MESRQKREVCLEVGHALVEVLPAGKNGEPLGALEGRLDDDERGESLVRQILLSRMRDEASAQGVVTVP